MDVNAQHVGRQLRADVVLETLDPALVTHLAVDRQESFRPLGRERVEARAKRLVIALGRHAGLRIPSEVAVLTWEDIAWDTGRLTVRSPKTARHEGHAVRIVPICPQHQAILAEAYERATEGEKLIPADAHRGVEPPNHVHEDHHQGRVRAVAEVV